MDNIYKNRRINKTQPITRGIKHWGLSGYSSIQPRIKFGVTGQESSPQSPTISYRHPLSVIISIISCSINEKSLESIILNELENSKELNLSNYNEFKWDSLIICKHPINSPF